MIYAFCALIAIAFMTKYIINMIAILMDRDPGCWKIMYMQPIVWMLLKTAGFGAWWGLSEAKFDNDCDASDFDPEDKRDLCAENGSIVPMLAFAFSVIAGVVALLNNKMQTDKVYAKVHHSEVMGCSHRFHSAIIFVMINMIFGLIIAAVVIQEWVSFEVNSDNEREGGIFTVDKASSVDNLGFDCLAEPACDVDDDSTECLTWDALRKGGMLYFTLQIVNFCLVLMWFGVVYHLFAKVRDWGHPILNYTFPHLAWVVHLIAIIMWSVITKAKFADSGECDNDDVDSDEMLDVCVTVGPYIAIV
jgi:hypothetical protein